ncbi:MAG TPA: response regulator [Bryobacteraceae bacterium]|jgi:PAS domain S-box-containing protein
MRTDAKPGWAASGPKRGSGRPAAAAEARSFADSEAGFRDFAESLVQHIDEVFFWRNPDCLQPYYVSQAYERIWGQSCESAYAHPSSWIESIHPDDRDRVIREFACASPDPAQLEYRIIRPDGGIRWIWARSFPVRDDAGTLTRLIGIAQDCTDRKYAERTQAFLASIVESSDDSIVGTDLDGRVASWNRGAERLFGYTAEEAIGKLITMLFPQDRQSDYVQVLQKIRRQEHIERFESVRVAKDGRPIPVLTIVSPIRDRAGRLQGVSAIYRDMTTEKKAAADLLRAKDSAEAASRAKSTFLATMSHEIRTPMNGILGMTELVLESDVTADQRESLDLVKVSTESLLSVINDILDFSKIEAGKLDFEAIPFDFRDSLGETMRTLGFRASQKGLELIYDVRPDVPGVLIGDAGRLRQILVNLVGNAIKFTERGEILVKVEVQSSTAETVCLHFSVQDTGVGIPVEKHQKIFEAFSQADDSMTRKYGGTGLGLTICGRLVEMMQGSIWVESEGGQGSTFHFTTRLGVPHETSAQTTPLQPEELRGLRVLIVDDNRTNRRVMLGLLSQWGMRPLAVEGGRAALRAVESAKHAGEPFALVLLDGQMPEMDGFSLAGKLQEHPGWEGATIMMLTSADQLGDGARCRDLGISAYLVKPVRQSELLSKICNRLEHTQKHNAPAPGPQAAARPANQTRVLVAEDNRVNQALVRRLLAKQGYEITVVGDGGAAVAALAEGVFDIVLMDVQMPGMDGFAATAMIREQEQRSGQHIPIIAMTAHALKGDHERCLAEGMDAYVSKPIRRDELFTTVERLLHQRSLDRGDS